MGELIETPEVYVHLSANASLFCDGDQKLTISDHRVHKVKQTGKVSAALQGGHLTRSTKEAFNSQEPLPAKPSKAKEDEELLALVKAQQEAEDAVISEKAKNELAEATIHNQAQEIEKLKAQLAAAEKPAAEAPPAADAGKTAGGKAK